MQLVVRLGVTLAVIVAAELIGKRMPTLGGLLATLPLTAVVVMLWLNADRPDQPQVMIDYTKGALFGLGPAVVFFVAVWLALRHGFPMWMVVPAAFGVWLLAAVIHQLALR